MISSLTGILKTKNPTEVVVDVNGVGYAVSIPLSTFERLGAQGSTVSLYTHMVVREDAMQLYGFATDEERQIFRLLMSVNGIGPKIAQGILSGISVPELKNFISGGNVASLTAIPGVGKKTAERLIIELRDKIGKLLSTELPGSQTDHAAEIRSQALLALTSLGYQRATAEKAIRQALNEKDGTTLPLEGLIKRALQFTSNR
ncbi:MAG TPA: Holliday junction branch migration protein RuvA [Bacteroidota bacterium]